MASDAAALVRSLCGRPATPAEWSLVVGAARSVLSALGEVEFALPDDLMITPVGAMTAASPDGGVTMIMPEFELRAIAAGPSSGLPQYAVAVAALWHELAHVSLLRKLPALAEVDGEQRTLLEAVALAAQSRVMAELVGAGTWQNHLAVLILAARDVAKEIGDPLLDAYENAASLLLGELEALSYPELVERVVVRLRPP